MPNTYSSTGFACIDGIYTATRQGGYPGGNDGVLFICMPANDYNAIRGYDSATGTSTIHWFGTSWANGTLGNSTGALNLDGHCGATLGPWNGPILIAHKGVCSVGINTGNTTPNTHNGRGLVVNGRGADTRGIIELWDGGASGGKSVLQQVGGDTYLGQLARGTGNGHLYFLTGGSGASATVSMMVSCSGLVGIGTGSPSSKLDVVGTQYADLMMVRLLDQATQATGTGGGIGFGGKYNVAGDVTEFALIRGLKENSTSGEYGGYLSFSTRPNLGQWTERMRVASNGYVGIGTINPQSALHVCGPLAVSPTGTGVHIGVDTGGYAGIQLSGGTAQGGYIDFSCTGADAPGRIIYYHASNSLDFTVCAASRMTIVCNGNIGVGNTSPTYKFQVNGTFYAAGSSADYKQDVCQYNTDSCMFMKLNAVTYQYKDEYCHLGKELKSGTQIGLIAEDVAEIYPELAILVNEEDEKVVRNVDYEKLSIILLSELQKLRAEVDELKSK